MFSDADTNRDGRVPKAEFAEAKLRRVFNKLDLNGDQKITADEWKRFDNSPQAAAHFAALDENGDQYITVAEFLKLARSIPTWIKSSREWTGMRTVLSLMTSCNRIPPSVSSPFPFDRTIHGFGAAPKRNVFPPKRAAHDGAPLQMAVSFALLFSWG